MFNLILNIFKKKSLIDYSKYQYVREHIFYWDSHEKKVVQIYWLDYFAIMSRKLEFKQVNVILLSKKFTYNDFLKKYNHHNIVFYINYNGSIIDNNKLSFYAEIDYNKLRKIKLEKIQQNLNI